METEDFECNQCVNPVDTVGSVHSGIMVDSAEIELLESAGESEKAIPGDVEAAGSSDTRASGGDVDSKGGGLVSVTTEAVMEKREAFECDLYPVDVEAAASEQDGPMMASTRSEGFDSVSTVDDFRVLPSEQRILMSSPEAPKIEEEAHVTMPGSSLHLNQEVASTVIPVSNPGESFGVASVSGKIEGDKFVDSTFHDLDENQESEHTYEIDFDIDGHEMPLGESLFDDSCLFPALETEKTEAWHAGVDAVIMVEASAQTGSKKQHTDVDAKSFPGERNSEPVAMHEIKKNDVVGKEDWLPDIQRQSGSETLLVDALHGAEKSSELNRKQAQEGHEQVACVNSKDADAQALPLQYDTQDIFASLTGATVETADDADTLEAKRLEEEVSTKVAVEESKLEPTSFNMTHEDVAVRLYELDKDMTGGLSAMDVEHDKDMTGGSSAMDVEHLKTEDASEDLRLESDVGDEIVTQVEAHGKGLSSDFEKEDECIDMQTNEANVNNQLMVKNNDLPIDSSGRPCTNNPSFILNGNTDSEFMPIVGEQQGSAGVFSCRETLMEAVSEAPSTNSPASILNGNMEPEYVPSTSEQGESASVMVCGETSMEDVAGPLAQEDASMFEQNALHDKVAGDNNESQAGHDVLSHVKADALVEPVQYQSSELEVADIKSVNEFDEDVLLVRNNDVKDIYESGVIEMGKIGEQEEKASSKEHEQSDEKVVHSNEKPSKSKLEETHASGDEIEVVTNAEHEKNVSIEEQKQSFKGSADEFDDSVQEVEKSSVQGSLGSRAGVAEGEVSVAEQEKEAANEELKDHSLTPLAGSVPPQAESVKELKEKELSPSEETIHQLSSSDHKTNVKAGTDSTLKIGGLKDSEDSAPLGQSGDVRGLSADASSKKKSERDITADKLPKAEHPNKSKVRKSKEVVGSKHVGDHVNAKSKHLGDHVNAKSRPELEGEPIGKMPEKAMKQGFAFGIGDLVWAKVRSHPWWPAQIFDPADASKAARKAKKSGRVLVAFFGDCTFAWLQQSQMIAFRPNFKEKVQQTTMKIFCLAVEEALEELCRRSELGLSCKHFEGVLHSTSSFPDANTGIREGVRGESLKKIRASAEMFRPKKMLEFVKNVAASPFGDWSSTLHWAESRGHAYGVRTCMVAMQGSDSALVLPTPPVVPSQGPKLKRSHASLDAGLPDAGNGGKESKKAKKLKSEKERKQGHGSLAGAEKNKRVALDDDAGRKLHVKDLTDASGEKKDRNVIKIKLSKMMKSDHSSSSEMRLDTASGEEIGDERVSDDSQETLLAMAGSVKPLKRSSSKQEKGSSTSKKVRRLIVEETKDDTSTHRAGKASLCEGVPDMDADVTGMEDASVVPSPPRGGGKKMGVPKMSAEFGLKKEVPVKDNNAGKSESARKLSKVGDSLRRVASELTGTPMAKVVDDVRRSESSKEKKMESASERDASPVGSKAISKEVSEDVSLLQLRRDLELVAKKAGSVGAKGKAIKHSKKGGGQLEAGVSKSSPQWQSVPQRSQRSCVQELALAARKRKSEIVHDEVVAKLPKNSSTTGSQRHHAPKGYITSAEKPGERRSYDKSFLLYSRRPAPPTSTAKSSSQRQDEKLSSHTPLGLFMRFPEDFPLPSEAQLKATFIPYGPLQMSATRLYKDSASAQVVFKHGRDAESALKHAKKNSLFGQVAVTYRLRHLSHSTKVEAKTDTPSPNKAYSFRMEGSAPSRDASLEKKAGNEELGSPLLSPSNHETHSASEPTGDIKDQMMTLLRQVSVIVNTSPVTSDGT